LWNDKHAEKDVIPTFQRSLRDLQLDYLDLYLIRIGTYPPFIRVSYNAMSPYAPLRILLGCDLTQNLCRSTRGYYHLGCVDLFRLASRSIAHHKA